LPLDVDNDGNLDIVAVGNSYAPEALTGRYDASIGWVLLGDGRGNFKTEKASTTGFTIRGDARSLITLNFHGRQLIIAAQNKGHLKQHVVVNSSSIVPLLKNDVQVFYYFKNGKKRKQEFYYGSSYYSQSGKFVSVNSAVQSLQIRSSNGSERILTYN
jgi:enediyne biosynthesis protein E4